MFSVTRNRILFLSWITYASFYLLRVNMSVAIPGIMATFDLSRTTLGAVESAFFALYAVGQFVNGQLADRYGAKRLLSLGLLVSIGASLLLTQFGGIVGILLLLWGVNGFFQAMGWSPTVRVVNSWFQSKGKIAGILGTSYIIGGALSWILAGQTAKIGWQAIFWVPAIVCLVVLLFYMVFVKEREATKPVPLNRTVKACIGNRYAWYGGLGLFGLNIVRYGFLVWAPTFFFETQHAEITSATYKALVFPLAGALGALAVGWLTDKYFHQERGLVALSMCIVLAGACFILPSSPNWMTTLVLLAVIGFTVFGPHSYVVTQLPMLIGRKTDIASITGFIDGMGYIGASITGVVSGMLVDRIGWSAAMYFWVGGAIVAGIFMWIGGRRRNERTD